jgi:4-carboxymuconolactone decarboxylase
MVGWNDLHRTDRAYMGGFTRFAEREVKKETAEVQDETIVHMVILAALIGCQGLEVFTQKLQEALDAGFSPVIAKEILYQAVPYLGMGKVYPFIQAANEVMTSKGILLPLKDQSTTADGDRLDKGVEAQMAIFGKEMRDFWRNGTINRWLAAHCFGDHYTRGGLDLGQRELVTFCFLAALGGCDRQLSSHIIGNIQIGNDPSVLRSALMASIPYVGYPKMLNAISCLETTVEASKNRNLSDVHK